MIPKLAQQVIVGAAGILVAGFIIWLTVVASTLSAMQVELSGIHSAVIEVKTDMRREIDGVTHRVEILEARNR